MARQNVIEIIIRGEDKASGVLGKIGGSVKTLGKTALLGLATGAASVAGAATIAGAALTKMALDAAPIQGVEEAFKGTAAAMGRSSDELLASLQEASSGMVSQADLMKSFNQAQMLVGDSLTSQLAPAMGYLGKVSAATGEDMSYMMDSLVRGVGRLSPMILDNLGIQVDLTAANEAYAASIGKSVEELTKGEQQTALMNQVMEKLAENTANYPEVAGSAAANIAALRTKFTDLKNTIGKAVLPILTKVIGWLSEMADKVIPHVTKGIETFVNVVDAFLSGAPGDFPWEDIFPPWLADVMYKVSDLFEKTVSAIREFFGEIQRGHGVMAGLWEALVHFIPEETATKVVEFVKKVSDFVSKVVKWVSEFVSWKDVLIALGVAIAAVVIPALASIATAVAPVIAAGVALVAAIALVRNAWEKDWGGMRTKLTEFWEGTAKPALKALWEWLKIKIPEAIERAKQFWQEVLIPAFEQIKDAYERKIKPALTEVGAAFREAFAAMKEAWNELKPILGEIIGAFMEAFGKDAGKEPIEFAEIVEKVADLIVRSLKGLALFLEFLAKLTKKTLKVIEKFWDKHGDKILKLVKVFSKILQKDWKGLWEDVQEIVEDVLKAIGDEIKKKFEEFLRTIEDKLKDIKNAVKDAWDAIEDIIDKAMYAIQRAIDSWLDTLERLFERAWDAIEDIVDDAWDAIEDIVDRVTEAIRRTIDSWLDALERLFDLAWGAIEDIVDDAWDAIENIVDRMTAAIKSTIDSWLSAIKSAFETMWNSLVGVVEDAMDAVHDVVDAALRAIANLLAVGGAIWNLMMDMGRAIANAIVAGFQAVTDFVSRVATQLWNWLNQLITSATGWFDRAVAIGSMIVTKILDGITSWVMFGLNFVAVLSTQLWSWLRELVTTATNWFSRAYEIGTQIINQILAGFGSLRDAFIDWVRSKLIEWLGAVFSPVPEAQYMGAHIANEILAGFAKQRGAFIQGMRGELGDWMGGVGGLSLAMAGAGGVGAGLAGGATYSPTFNTTVNTPMEEEELYYRVEEILRRMG